MKSAQALILLFLVGLGLSACAPPAAAPLEPTETVTPTVELTATETIVWFPPTPTRTPAPTRETVPTPDERPGLGREILVDDFTDQEHWQVGQQAGGSVAYGKDELTLAVRQPKGTLLSLRDGPELKDFYLEITTKANLCRGNDMYGLLLRAQATENFYRFLINCQGELRVERAVNSQLSLVQDWALSGVVPPGSPLVLRVGVWAVGNEMRFFINDVYQFSISDPVIPSGTVGVYARSTGDTALTVSFSDLAVYAVDPDGDAALPESACGTPEPSKRPG